MSMTPPPNFEGDTPTIKAVMNSATAKKLDALLRAKN